MKNAANAQPLSVLNRGQAVEYIRVLFSQLDDLRRLLDEHGVRYSVDEYVSSWNGAPETTLVYLARGVDGARVQEILDSVE